MSGETQDVGELSKRIKLLPPDQVEGDLNSMMAHNGQNLLAAIVVGNEVEPVHELFHSIEGAIGRVSGAGSQADLAKKSIGSINSALRDKDFKPESSDQVVALAKEAQHFVDWAVSSINEADQLSDISRALLSVDVSSMPAEESDSVFKESFKYLDKATEAARDINDPAGRSRTLSKLASNAVWSLEQWKGQLPEDEDYVDQIVALHKEALQLNSEVKDIDERSDEHEEQIRSISEGAAIAKGINYELYEKLFALSISEVDKMLEQYAENVDMGQKPAPEKCMDMTVMGAALADYLDTDSIRNYHSPQREQLLDKIIELFRAGLDYAKQSNDPEIPNDNSRLGGNAHRALGLVRDLFEKNGDHDNEAAKELLGIGFDLAFEEDKWGGERALQISEAWGTVEDIARKQRGASAVFELHLLAHRKGKEFLDEEQKSSPHIKQNARDWLEYFARGEGGLEDDEPLVLDEVGREFVELAIEQVNDTDISHLWVKTRLEALSQLLVSNYDLQQIIKNQVEALTAAAEKAREPETETARIALELVSSDQD